MTESTPSRIIELLLHHPNGMSHRPMAETLGMEPDRVSAVMCRLVPDGRVLAYHDMAARGGAGRGVRLYWHPIYARNRNAYIASKATPQAPPKPVNVGSRPIERLSEPTVEWRIIDGILREVTVCPAHKPETKLPEYGTATAGLKPGRYVPGETALTRAYSRQSQWGSL